jgi:hypothetical protein
MDWGVDVGELKYMESHEALAKYLFSASFHFILFLPCLVTIDQVVWFGKIGSTVNFVCTGLVIPQIWGVFRFGQTIVLLLFLGCFYLRVNFLLSQTISERVFELFNGSPALLRSGCFRLLHEN